MAALIPWKEFEARTRRTSPRVVQDTLHSLSEWHVPARSSRKNRGQLTERASSRSRRIHICSTSVASRLLSQILHLMPPCSSIFANASRRRPTATVFATTRSRPMPKDLSPSGQSPVLREEMNPLVRSQAWTTTKSY